VAGGIDDDAAASAAAAAWSGHDDDVSTDTLQAAVMTSETV